MMIENGDQTVSLWNKTDLNLYRHLEEDFIEIFEDLLEKQGFSRMYGQILAIIFFKEVPMTQEDLERESRFSRSSINKAVNALINLGYIHKRQMGDGKKLVYYIEGGPKEIFLSGIQDYLFYFDKIFERFTKKFESAAELKGLPLKKIKDFVDHLPQIRGLLNNALGEINKLNFVFK